MKKRIKKLEEAVELMESKLQINAMIMTGVVQAIGMDKDVYMEIVDRVGNQVMTELMMERLKDALPEGSNIIELTERVMDDLPADMPDEIKAEVQSLINDMMKGDGNVH